MKKNVLINTNVLNVYVNRLTIAIMATIIALGLMLVCNPYVNVILFCFALFGWMYVISLIQEGKLNIGERVFKGKFVKWLNGLFEE